MFIVSISCSLSCVLRSLSFTSGFGAEVEASLLRRGQVHQVLQLISQTYIAIAITTDSVYTISLVVDRANSEKAPSHTFDYARCVVYLKSTS